jgi:hypothetical protein
MSRVWTRSTIPARKKKKGLAVEDAEAAEKKKWL